MFQINTLKWVYLFLQLFPDFKIMPMITFAELYLLLLLLLTWTSTQSSAPQATGMQVISASGIMRLIPSEIAKATKVAVKHSLNESGVTKICVII